MTFTYDLASSDATLLLISKVRLEIGDTIVGLGVRPNGSNLTDEEISLWLTEESDVVLLAAARACDALARAWANYVNTTAGKLKEELNTVSGKYEAAANSLRAQYESSLNDGRTTVYVL
jgi:hypothetical protein